MSLPNVAFFVNAGLDILAVRDHFVTAKTIHLVVKTHLDIGFTDHAASVRQQYHDWFIPQATATGEHFFNENPEQPAFVWTTGAWLIWDHLNSADNAGVKRLERAIERGLIVGHGLPFTTHTELMAPALFRAGLSYAQELDQRFARHTIAAKMTDVPGHTLGMVPLMGGAGVRPDVPATAESTQEAALELAKQDGKS